MTRRVATGLALLGLVTALSGCGSNGPSDYIYHSVIPRADCREERLPQGDLQSQGGTEIPWSSFRKPGVPGRPETFVEIRLVELENVGKKPMAIDRVCLIGAPHRSRDVLGGARITQAQNGFLGLHAHGSNKGVVPLRANLLLPDKAQFPQVPVLDLLIGPARHPGKFACSENVAIRVLYHTLDHPMHPQERQQIFPIAVEFPNHPGGSSATCDQTYNPWATYVAAHHFPPPLP